VSVPHEQGQRQHPGRRFRRPWFPPFAKDAKDGAPPSEEGAVEIKIRSRATSTSTAALQASVVPTFRKRRERWGTLVWGGCDRNRNQSQKQRQECPLHTSELGLHIGAEDGVDAGLVAGVLAEPAEKVGIEAHSYDFFGDRHDYFCVLPKGVVGGVGVGVGEDVAANISWSLAAQPIPVRAGRALGERSLRSRCFASSAVSRAVPTATPR
jgi:hypothetical protein